MFDGLLGGTKEEVFGDDNEAVYALEKLVPVLQDGLCVLCDIVKSRLSEEMEEKEKERSKDGVVEEESKESYLSPVKDEHESDHAVITTTPSVTEQSVETSRSSEGSTEKVSFNPLRWLARFLSSRGENYTSTFKELAGDNEVPDFSTLLRIASDTDERHDEERNTVSKDCEVKRERMTTDAHERSDLKLKNITEELRKKFKVEMEKEGISELQRLRISQKLQSDIKIQREKNEEEKKRYVKIASWSVDQATARQWKELWEKHSFDVEKITDKLRGGLDVVHNSFMEARQPNYLTNPEHSVQLPKYRPIEKLPEEMEKEVDDELERVLETLRKDLNDNMKTRMNELEKEKELEITQIRSAKSEYRCDGEDGNLLTGMLERSKNEDIRQLNKRYELLSKEIEEEFEEKFTEMEKEKRKEYEKKKETSLMGYVYDEQVKNVVSRLKKNRVPLSRLLDYVKVVIRQQREVPCVFSSDVDEMEELEQTLKLWDERQKLISECSDQKWNNGRLSARGRTSATVAKMENHAPERGGKPDLSHDTSFMHTDDWKREIELEICERHAYNRLRRELDEIIDVVKLYSKGREIVAELDEKEMNEQ